jgi:hypothetical protein
MSDHTQRKENDMRARLTKVLAGLAAVSALAFGGSALAGAANGPTPAAPSASLPATPAAPAVPAQPADGDHVEQGDQTTPDTGAADESSSESAAESASEPASSESGAEASDPSDGPGGHADEPGNPNATNQVQGQQ